MLPSAKRRGPLLPQEGKALAKRLGFRVSKVVLTKTFDFVGKLKVLKSGQVPELWERAEELIEEAVAHGDHLPHTPNVDITPNVVAAHNLNRSGSPLVDGKPQIPNPKPYKP